jgi:predicted nucleic acid-binding protein
MNNVLLVADSGPLIGLAGVSQLNLLPILYHRIVAPLAVINEIATGEQNVSSRNFLDQTTWLKHIKVESLLETLSGALGRGETEAISLAKQLPHSRLLLDDHRARKFADTLNLEVIGSAGILVQAKRRNFIQEVVPILFLMRENGYYISDRIIHRAAFIANETI